LSWWRIRLRGSGEPRRDSRTGDMIYETDPLADLLDSVRTLDPGDVIATGTAAGTGIGRTPSADLRPGDVGRAEIEARRGLETPIEARVEAVT
jgi:2-keto-4-pentenoate hydratase/2-oxohepta-3-ene-1,7-dioic acid hydratase in catechol pathway